MLDVGLTLLLFHVLGPNILLLLAWKMFTWEWLFVTCWCFCNLFKDYWRKLRVSILSSPPLVGPKSSNRGHICDKIGTKLLQLHQNGFCRKSLQTFVGTRLSQCSGGGMRKPIALYLIIWLVWFVEISQQCVSWLFWFAHSNILWPAGWSWMAWHLNVFSALL